MIYLSVYESAERERERGEEEESALEEESKDSHHATGRK